MQMKPKKRIKQSENPLMNDAFSLIFYTDFACMFIFKLRKNIFLKMTVAT